MSDMIFAFQAKLIGEGNTLAMMRVDLLRGIAARAAAFFEARARDYRYRRIRNIREGIILICVRVRLTLPHTIGTQWGMRHFLGL